MKFVVWGAGERGKYIIYHLGKNNVVAFIDTDKNKIGTTYDGISIIDYRTYLEKYKNICIIISTHEDEVIDELKKSGISHYYCSADCPENFQTKWPNDILKNEIQKIVDTKKKHIVYGNSLYSIILYQWLLELQLEHKPLLYMGRTCDKGIIRELKNEWCDCVVNKIEFEDNLGHIWITIEKDDPNIEKDIPAFAQKYMKNVLRYSEHIEAYRNPKIEQYKGIHQGKRCFVVATGPSLKETDLDILAEHNELCISVNSIYEIFDKTVWRPDYYVTTDYTMARDCPEALSYMDKDRTVSFYPDNSEPYMSMEDKEKALIYHQGRIAAMTGYIPVSEDVAQIVYCGGTVTTAAIQFAIYFGCEEIYLLGTDATGINEKYLKYGHFYKEKEYTSICFSGRVRTSYLSVKKYADEHNIKIYNATRGGELEIFERVELDSLFR